MENASEVDELSKIKDDLSDCEVWNGYTFDTFMTAKNLYDLGYRKQSPSNSTQQSKLVPIINKPALIKEIIRFLNIECNHWEEHFANHLIAKFGSPTVPSLEDIERILHTECDKSLRKYNKIRTMEVASAIHRLLTNGSK